MQSPQYQPPAFYASLHRNLNTLRDIYKIIYTARQLRQQYIRFKDEQGVVWELRQLGTANNLRQTTFTSHQPRA